VNNFRRFTIFVTFVHKCTNGQLHFYIYRWHKAQACWGHDAVAVSCYDVSLATFILSWIVVKDVTLAEREIIKIQRNFMLLIFFLIAFSNHLAKGNDRPVISTSKLLFNVALSIALGCRKMSHGKPNNYFRYCKFVWTFVVLCKYERRNYIQIILTWVYLMFTQVTRLSCPCA
jgi:hypothetical protein